MIGTWALILTLVVFGVSIVAATIALRSGHSLAIVLGVDALMTSLIGVVFNLGIPGELAPQTIGLFVVFPLLLGAGAFYFVARSDRAKTPIPARVTESAQR